MTDLIRRFWPGRMAEDDLSELVLMAAIVLDVDKNKALIDETVEKLNSNGCTTIEKLG